MAMPPGKRYKVDQESLGASIYLSPAWSPVGPPFQQGVCILLLWRRTATTWPARCQDLPTLKTRRREGLTGLPSKFPGDAKYIRSCVPAVAPRWPPERLLGVPSAVLRRSLSLSRIYRLKCFADNLPEWQTDIALSSTWPSYISCLFFIRGALCIGHWVLHSPWQVDCGSTSALLRLAQLPHLLLVCPPPTRVSEASAAERQER